MCGQKDGVSSTVTDAVASGGVTLVVIEIGHEHLLLWVFLHGNDGAAAGAGVRRSARENLAAPGDVLPQMPQARHEPVFRGRCFRGDSDQL